MYAKDQGRVVTPTGTASFPYLKDPDTKFDAFGDYKVDLVVDPNDPEVKAYIDRLEQEFADWKRESSEQGRNITEWNPIPVKPHTDADGQETGKVIIKFKRKAGGISKKTQKQWKKPLPLFDADLREFDGSPGPGSQVRVSADIIRYQSSNKGGVRLSLAGVQVLRAAGGGDDAKSLGFGTPSGGSEFAEEQDATPDSADF